LNEREDQYETQHTQEEDHREQQVIEEVCHDIHTFHLGVDGTSEIDIKIS
jgi:hypothetical protein